MDSQVVAMLMSMQKDIGSLARESDVKEMGERLSRLEGIVEAAVLKVDAVLNVSTGNIGGDLNVAENGSTINGKLQH